MNATERKKLALLDEKIYAIFWKTQKIYFHFESGCWKTDAKQATLYTLKECNAIIKRYSFYNVMPKAIKNEC